MDLARSSSTLASPGAWILRDGHVELGILAGEVLGAVGLREGDLHDPLVADLGADELLLEARDERAGAELEVDPLALAALELLAVDAADEVDGDAVAGLGLGALLALGERAALTGHALEGLVDLRVGGLGDELGQADVGQVGELEARHHLEGDLEGEVALGVERLLDLGLVARELDLRLQGELEAVVGDDLAVGLVDGVLHHLGHDRAAVDLAQVGHRHLAGAEALELHLVLHAGQLVGQALLEFLGGQQNLKLALQPRGGGPLGVDLGHLHRRRRSSKNLWSPAGPASCGVFARPGCRGCRVRRRGGPRRTAPTAERPGAGGGARTPTSCDTGT